MNKKISVITLVVLNALLLPLESLLAQTQFPEPFAYPTQNQSQTQQQEDHFACYTWAKQETGVDPSQLSPTTTSQSSQQGTVLRTTAKGSLAGTAIGAIAGNTGEGAAIGAGVGALTGFIRKREAQQQAQQQQAQANVEEQQRLQTYYRAWTACMDGKGYTVK
ncbi:MAG: hypothetical protein N5P05_001721 [Chroococcopsis gigantea SAG 12.99]|jgi:hypothetical protein|nr:hypothetical protein [Chlorogloea purpurea SAG 13.99]MDV3000115.1 hypothetical protein [Chroococcopsis gigantea SAG 12.99]